MKTKDLSSGNPAKVLILFALPMILSVTLQQIYNIADSSIAGRMISKDALSAVSVSYPINMIYLSFATGLGVGIGVITSRFFGSKEYHRCKTTINTALLFTFILAAIMSILGIIIAGPSLRLIDTPNNIFKDSRIYLRYYCGGLVFTYLYNVITAIFQSMGNSRTPLYFLMFSTVLNIVLDIIFVGPLDMEIVGLALGTLIAQAMAMGLSLVVLLMSLKKELVTSDEIKVFDLNVLRLILIIAIPSIIQGSTISIGNFLVQRKLNSFGSELVGGYGAAFKLCYVVVNIFVAYSNAISNYTAQNIGAGKHKRIIAGFKWSLLICSIFSLVMTMFIMVFNEQLLKIFMSNDAKNVIDSTGKAQLDYGKSFCMIVAPFFIFMGIKIPSDGVLKGSKDMASFMFGTFVDLIIRVVLSFALAPKFGYRGVFASWPIGWGVGMLVSVIMFMYGRWKKLACFPLNDNNVI